MTGRTIKLAGWVVCLVAVAVYGWHFLAEADDSSAGAYSSLIAVEGLVFVGFGCAIIVFGWWLEKRQNQGTGDTRTTDARDRTLLVWLFRGQSLVLLAANLLAGLWLAIPSNLSAFAGEDGNSLSMVAIIAASTLVFAGLPWWIGLRLNNGAGIVPAILYSVVSLFAFPVGTVLGGVQLLLLRRVSRESRVIAVER